MKQVLVIGAARSGSAVAKLLAKHGYHVVLSDQNVVENKRELEGEGIRVVDKGHPEELLHTNYEFVVKNPGIPYRVPIIKYFVEHHVPVYTEIEIAYRYAKKFHYGAVTGTNGKTTITSILHQLLSYKGNALAAGNIGTPLSEYALHFEEEEKWVALELSNFQLLGCESFHPEVAVVCNLTPDHLDYMGSVEAYYESKMKVYANQNEEDWFLRNVDDEEVMKYAKDIPATIIDFSLVRDDVDLYLKEGSVYLHDIKLFDVSILKIVGMHNISNAMVAACMAYKLGVSIDDIQKGLASFKAVEHRLEYVAEKNGVKFYNDSKATNPEAVVPALNAFEKNVLLLAGGYDKKLPFDVLKQFDDKIKMCYAFGETKNAFKDVFTNVTLCENMNDALVMATSNAVCGDVVLLSPACASYDQFVSYEQRGEVFKVAVHQYVEKD